MRSTPTTRAAALLAFSLNGSACSAAGARSGRELSPDYRCLDSKVVTVSNGLKVDMDVWDFSGRSPCRLGRIEARRTATHPLATSSRVYIRVVPPRCNAGYTSAKPGLNARDRVGTWVHCAGE